MKKCKKLLTDGFIENVKTMEGDIIVLYKDMVDGHIIKKVVIYQEDFDQLLVLVGKDKEKRLDTSKLDSCNADTENSKSAMKQEKDT